MCKTKQEEDIQNKQSAERISLLAKIVLLRNMHTVFREPTVLFISMLFSERQGVF